MIRFGLHDFLNAQPLLVPLVRQQKELGVKIVPGVPSLLADKLKAGELDLAPQIGQPVLDRLEGGDGATEGITIERELACDLEGVARGA